MTSLLHKWWDEYAALGMKEDYHAIKKAKIQLMNHTYALGGLSFLIFFALKFFNYIETDSIPVISILFFPIMLILSSKNLHTLSWHLTCVSAIIILSFSAYNKPVCFANYTLYGTLFLMMMHLFSESRKYLLFYLLSIGSSLIFFTWTAHQSINQHGVYSANFSISIILSSLIFNFLIIRFYLKRKNLNEQKLARAICLKKAALDANKDAILITDLNQKITDFNKPYLKLWGLSKEQMEERDAAIWTKYGLAKIKNKKVIKESLGRVLKNKAANSFDIVYLKDGRILENYTRPQILNGEIVGRVFNFSDVTERYTAAKKLRISENRLRNLFDYSPLGIVILEDNEKPFLNVNRQFCLMMGYTEKELLNKKVEDITFEKHHYIHSELYKKLQEGTIDEFKIKKKYVRKSGEIFWGNTNISVIRDIKGKIINEVIFIEDIHEQQEQEQRIQELVIELKLLNEALEHKIKLKTLDLRQANQELRRSNQDLEQFAYIASHDLQEPLRMIGNFVQLLERQYKDQIDEEGKEYIHYVVDGVNRMSKLIQNLLKYSRVGRKEAALRVVDLGKIIEAKLFGLSRKMQECNAKVKILDMPKQVYCEPDQIGMVFFNLMTNALKFNTGSPNIEIGFKEEETAQLFYIKDNGIGIDKRYETKVFEIFKRLHRREEYEGTGIGLALCKKIIDRHKGKIWFESELGEGTTFYFTISKNLQNEGLVPFDSNLISRGQ